MKSHARVVVVGEVRFSVSATRPASNSPAISAGGFIPERKKHSATIVLVEPTGSLRNRMGWEVVRVPIRWWSIISRPRTCRLTSD